MTIQEVNDEDPQSFIL